MVGSNTSIHSSPGVEIWEMGGGRVGSSTPTLKAGGLGSPKLDLSHKIITTCCTASLYLPHKSSNRLGLFQNSLPNLLFISHSLIHPVKGYICVKTILFIIWSCFTFVVRAELPHLTKFSRSNPVSLLMW